MRGGSDFWSNGIHLNTIEAAGSARPTSRGQHQRHRRPAEAILRCESQLTVAAVGGNTGAGGCFLARAADFVCAHGARCSTRTTQNMGNLFGSEFWTYLFPPAVGEDGAAAIMRHSLCR